MPKSLKVRTAARQRAMAEIRVRDPEMAEIESDKVLRRRLKAGHRDAAARRGRFTPNTGSSNRVPD